MSHGGGKSGKGHGKEKHIKTKSGDDFSRAIAKIAVAQICESAGFQAFQQSALDLLSDITVRYIHNLGKLSHSFANLAGRTESNALDIIQGLEEVVVASQGLNGSSDVDHCIASSGTVRELAQYVAETEDIPFAYSIPPFPVTKERNPISSFSQIGESPRGAHIPFWLPAFPKSQLSMENKGIVYSNLDKIDRHHLDLPQQSTTVDLNLEVKSNPFLTPPLQFGEKVVSDIVIPAKLFSEASLRSHIEQNRFSDIHVSVVDTFAPAIEAIKSMLSDSEESEKTIMDRRPALRFKIGFGRKSLESKSQNKDIESISLAFGKDGEKDEKKRRAEKILKQSIKNPGELPQM